MQAVEWLANPFAGHCACLQTRRLIPNQSTLLSQYGISTCYYTNALHDCHFVCSSQTVFSLPFRQIKNCCLVSFVVMVITGFLREFFGNFVKVTKTPSFFVLLQLYSSKCFMFEILFLFGNYWTGK